MFLTIRPNDAGDYVGLAKSRGTITFDEGFGRLAGNIQIDGSDVQGNIVGSVKFTSRGTRIHVERFDRGLPEAAYTNADEAIRGLL